MNSNKTSTNLKVDLDNIDSSFFVQGIFGLIDKKKAFEIIKYNKKLQNKCNISLKDYKEYSRYLLYDSPIEIEIIHRYRLNCYFIKISSWDWNNIHIYFDDRKEEIKRCYFTNEDVDVNKIKVIIDPKITMLDSLFSGCSGIESISFKKFSRINIVDMSYMFFRCESLKKIDFSHFKTDKVKNMSCMFSQCKSLEKLDLSNFKTDNVERMDSMFDTCKSLEKLDLSNFNTNNVNQMQGMFSCCFSLKELSLSSFNTNNVLFMKDMFFNCSSLKDLNLSNFKTNKVINMYSMFSGCKSLIKLDISNFNVYKVENFGGMFFNCSSLKELKLPSFDINIQKVKIDGMFNGCSEELKNKIKEIYPNLIA